MGRNKKHEIIKHFFHVAQTDMDFKILELKVCKNVDLTCASCEYGL